MNDYHDEEHDLIDISNKKSFEDSDIDYKDTISELDELTKNSESLYNKIQEEIKNLDNINEKLLDEIKTSFEKKHEKLEEEEDKLKSELNNKITEFREKLKQIGERSLDIMLICEKNKKLSETYLEKDNIKKIKKLYYISKINEDNIINQSFMKKPVKNVEISYKLDSFLDYKYYYFYGIPIPENIEVERGGRKLKISWDVYIRDEEADKNKMKYELLIKEGKIISFHETFLKYFLLDKYEVNTPYEIKIRTLMNGSNGEWSETKRCIARLSPDFDSEVNNIFKEKNDNNKDEYEDISYYKPKDGYKESKFSFNILENGKNRKIFKSNNIYKNIEFNFLGKNEVKKEESIFGKNSLLSGGLFKLENSKKEGECSFRNKENKDNKLIFNDKLQYKGIFGNNIFNENNKQSLFGSHNKTENENNKNGVFSLLNNNKNQTNTDDKKCNVFGNDNNKKPFENLFSNKNLGLFSSDHKFKPLNPFLDEYNPEEKLEEKNENK